MLCYCNHLHAELSQPSQRTKQVNVAAAATPKHSDPGHDKLLKRVNKSAKEPPPKRRMVCHNMIHCCIIYSETSIYRCPIIGSVIWMSEILIRLSS